MIQQNKLSQNGLKSNLRYSTLSSGNTASTVSNGRKSANLETHVEHVEKILDNDNSEKELPVFAKPFKIPVQPDHLLPKIRPTNHIDHSSSHNDGGKDVESILKMMTSTCEPLTKIAATPRTDIDVQTPKKPHVYANLPPLLRDPTNDCTNSKYKFIGIPKNTIAFFKEQLKKKLYFYKSKCFFNHRTFALVPENSMQKTL